MEVVERFGALSFDKSKYMKNNTLLFCMVFIAAVVFFIKKNLILCKQHSWIFKLKLSHWISKFGHICFDPSTSSGDSMYNSVELLMMIFWASDESRIDSNSTQTQPEFDPNWTWTQPELDANSTQTDPSLIWTRLMAIMFKKNWLAFTWSELSVGSSLNSTTTTSRC